MNILIALYLLAATNPNAGAELTPAEHSLEEAKSAIASKPGDAVSYNSLAMALIRRARETSDDRFYTQAGEAVRKSLEITPGNFEGRKMQTFVLLGQHDFSAALAEAQTLNKTVADDVSVYGLLADAYSALGDYPNAEKSAQWMLNLRPGNVPAFVHAAQLREVFGDFGGSYDALDLAYQSTSPTEFTDRAALLTQMGRERRLAGKYDDAQKLIKQALDLFPGENAALGELAEVYMAEKRSNDSVPLLQKLCSAVPTAQNRDRLAEALEASGQAVDARKSFESFLSEAMQESTQKNNANRELTLYYTDRAHQPAKALEVITREHAWRQDIFTLDAYAWALHANGQDQAARKQMDIALAVGTRDPGILAHSEAIKVSAAVR